MSESERVHLVVEETQGHPRTGCRWVSVQVSCGSHLLMKVDIRSGYPEQAGRQVPEWAGEGWRPWEFR